MVKSLKETYFVAFHDWCTQSSSHGIPNVARSRNWFTRVMWLLVLLGSTGYCSYNVIKTIMQYYKYEKVVSINNIKELPATFPAITICNINPFNEIYSKEYLTNMTRKLEGYECFNRTIISYIYGYYQYDQTINKTEIIETENFCYSTKNKNIILDKLVDRLKRLIASDIDLTADNRSYYGFQLDRDMLVSCSYNSIDCSEKDFKSFWSNEYGNCYTFNDASIRNQSLEKTNEIGQKYGLAMELVVAPRSANDTIFAYKTGLYLLVHNQSSLPLTLKNGINILPGTETYVGVSRTITTKLDSPYSDCHKTLESDNNYAKKLFGYFNDLNVSYYDQDFCFTLCYQDKLIEKCGCCDIITPSIRNANYCSNDEEVNCVTAFRANFSKADLNQFCEYACVEACNFSEYKLSVNMARFPTRAYLDYLVSNSSYSFFPQNSSNLESFAQNGFLKIIVNYDSVYYTSITETPAMSFEDLLGSIGGQLGLFIGISFLSFIELFELFSEFIFIFYEHQKEKKKLQQTPMNQNLNAHKAFWRPLRYY